MIGKKERIDEEKKLIREALSRADYHLSHDISPC